MATNRIDNLIKDIKRIVSKNLSKEANELNNMTNTYKSELYHKVEEVELTYEKEESEKRVTDYEDKLDKIQELCKKINKL